MRLYLSVTACSVYSRYGDIFGTWPSSTACSNSLLIASVETQTLYLASDKARAHKHQPALRNVKQCFRG